MKQLLENITIGHTTTVNGYAVTRWSDSAYEVGTWGRSTVNLDEALSLVRK